MLLGAITLTIVGGIWLFTRPAASPTGPRPTAIVQTTTPTAVPTLAPTPTPVPLDPGQIGVGFRVRITGTGAAGLSVRTSAGTEAERLVVAEENEIFLVVGGPQSADGYTWWFIRDEVNPEREGWAVQDFLSPTE